MAESAKKVQLKTSTIKINRLRRTVFLQWSEIVAIRRMNAGSIEIKALLAVTRPVNGRIAKVRQDAQKKYANLFFQAPLHAQARMITLANEMIGAIHCAAIGNHT